MKNTSVEWKGVQYILDALYMYFFKKKPGAEIVVEELKDYLIENAVPELLATFMAVKMSESNFEKFKEISKYLKDKFLNRYHDKDLTRMITQYKNSINAGTGL